MAHNRLYCLIRDGKVDGALSHERIKFKKNMDQTRYAIYELPLIQAKLADGQGDQYYLESHHLSFYEVVDRRNPELSEYHYTAILRHHKGQFFRLHVYFDHKDQLTKEPVLAGLSEDGSYQKVSCRDDVVDSLLQLANKSGFSVISALRKEQVTFLNSLETRFQQTEDRLSQLSTDLAVNQAQYLEMLVTAQEMLAQLTLYAYEDYHALSLLLGRISAALQAVPALSELKEENDASNVATLSGATAEAGGSVPAPGVSSAPRFFKPMIPREESAAQLILALEDAGNRFSAAEKVTDGERVSLFNRYHANVHQALHLIEEAGYAATMTDLQKLKSHVLNLNKEGKQLLTQLLLGGKFDDATRLVGLLNPTPANLVRMALQVNNAKLLDFLLTHGDFPINTFIVRDGLNPVQFCYRQHTDKSSKAEVLSVLVKHGASIMVPAPDGLPIAYHIFREHNPLQPTVYACLKNAKQFFRMLVLQLKDFPSNPDVESAIVMFSRSELIESACGTGMKRLDKRYANDSARLENALAGHYQRDAIEQLKRDPDVRVMVERNNSLFKKFMSKIPPAEKRKVKVENQRYMAGLDEVLKGADTSSVDLKQAIMNNLACSIRILEARIELVDVQNMLRTSNTNSRALKKADKRQQELVREINELTVPYRFFSAVNPSSSNAGLQFGRESTQVFGLSERAASPLATLPTSADVLLREDDSEGFSLDADFDFDEYATREEEAGKGVAPKPSSPRR